MQNAEILRIKEKLQYLIKTDTDKKTFGANEPWNGHQYVLNPTLTTDEIQRFESYVDIKLPEDYKLFLAQIADGDAGPFYGLYFLNEAAEQTKSRITEKETKQDWIDCFAMFPELEPKHSETDIKDLLLIEGKDPKTYFEPDFPLTYPISKQPLTGVIFLSEYGCGGYYVLVVKGKYYGTVWFYQSQEYLAPIINSDLKRFSFLDWYEYWLDDSLKKL